VIKAGIIDSFKVVVGGELKACKKIGQIYDFAVLPPSTQDRSSTFRPNIVVGEEK